MKTKRRRTEALRRREERWQREDEAKRLLEEVPSLLTMSIEIQELSDESGHPPTKYIRRVPLPAAPALFEVPCSEHKCEDGGYDITAAVLDGLRAARATFEGTVYCAGNLPEHPCSRRLHWMVKATYDEAQEADAA